MNPYPVKHSIFRVGITCAVLSACTSIHRNAQETQTNSIQKQLSALEASTGGRIGFFAINTANDTIMEYRAEERFPMCSTFKLMAAAAILKKSMTDENLLKQRLNYERKDVTNWGYTPITSKHVKDGMTVEELCAASLQYSDNGVNLLTQLLGGPQQLTFFLRSIGDSTFRLDRWEPELSSAIPGDLRDTTTPAATGASLQKIVLGNILGQPQRKQLEDWLRGNTTGDARIRAGVPKGWLVGDKTGTCDYGTTNDIGIIWPPNRAPIVVVIYFTQKEKDAAARNDVIATATKFLVDEIN
jgi:beta-lactamase class A